MERKKNRYIKPWWHLSHSIRQNNLLDNQFIICCSSNTLILSRKKHNLNEIQECKIQKDIFIDESFYVLYVKHVHKKYIVSWFWYEHNFFLIMENINNRSWNIMFLMPCVESQCICTNNVFVGSFGQVQLIHVTFMYIHFDIYYIFGYSIQTQRHHFVAAV